MSVRKISEIEEIQGNEGTQIKQIFHPHNTLNGIRYSVSHFTIEKGKRSKIHKMKTSEIYYILEGEGILYVDDEKIDVKKDSSVYVAPMSKQHIENIGNSELRFLCIVDPAWKQDDEILLE
jgi:mannose-6-phosphate isomerase-like protein (cupin superfamily)